MKDIQGKVFSDFDVPSTSDGSFGGRKNITEKTKAHMDMKFKEELAKVNNRLKSSKTKVSLKVSGGVIQLVATLPLKPDDTSKQGKETKQYKISLGIPASFEGLKTAEEESYELGKLIARQTFTWNDKYLGKQAKKKNNTTFKEFYENFEQKYFETRKRTIKSEHSFNNYKSLFKTRFLVDDIVSEENLKKIIKTTITASQRREAIKLAWVIAKIFNYEVDFSELRLKYVPRQRDIPDDKTIVLELNKFEEHYLKLDGQFKRFKNNWKAFKTFYSLLAIYGLRPREILNNSDINWLMSPENVSNTFKVHESNKTGYREVFPFVPEWIELFDLKNQENINELRKIVIVDAKPDELKHKVSSISGRFKACGVSFTPYDLRHACAIRAHLQGVPIKAASDNLGHTVEIHTKTYQRWFGLENRKKAFNQAFEEEKEIDKLKDALTKANKRIAELEIENARLKFNRVL